MSEKGDVSAWEKVWRVSDPKHVAVVLCQARKRDDEIACLAGLIRSTFPETK